MWHDHLFSQRNRKIEKSVGIGVGGDREVRGGGGRGEGRGSIKFEKGEVVVGDIGRSA